jgi:hypothetical protein
MRYLKLLVLMSFIVPISTHAQDPFVEMLNAYAVCTIEFTKAQQDQTFMAEQARAGCKQQVDMIEMVLTAEMAQPILAEVEVVVVERLVQ